MTSKIKFLVSIDKDNFEKSKKETVGDNWSNCRYFKRYFLEQLSWEHVFDVVEVIIVEEVDA